MTKHKLKLDACYYPDSAVGIKTFEIRENDRNYQVGDILELREWVWSALDGKGTYTGEVHWKIITYILDDNDYLQDGYVCLAVSPIAEIAEPEKEIFDCQHCKHLLLSDKTNRLFCSYHGEGEHQYEVFKDDYCSYFERSIYCSDGAKMIGS